MLLCVDHHVTFCVCGRIKLTSRLWGAAVQKLEVEVVGAKTLALQVLQQLPESVTKRLRAVQAVSIVGHFDLEVLILTYRTRLPQVDLEGEREKS